MDEPGLTVKQISTAHREQWNNVVLNASEGTFFHSFDWSETIRVYGEKTGFFVPRHIFVADKEIVGVLPLFLDEKRRLVSLPYGDYGGPCLIPSVKKDEVLKLLFKEAEEIARREASEIRLKSLPEGYSEWLRALRYQVNPYMYTFLLPIQNLTMEDLWRSFRRDARRGIKKAETEGVVIEEAQEKELMREYYKIYPVSMKQIGASVRPFIFFDVLWDTLFPNRLLNVFLAKYQDKYIAGLIFFAWKKRLHIYGNVSLPQYHNLRPNDLLYYEAIKWGIEKNFHVVDFGLTPLDCNSGLYQFKERWRASRKLLFLTSKKYAFTAILRQKIHDLYPWNLLESKLRKKRDFEMRE